LEVNVRLSGLGSASNQSDARPSSLRTDLRLAFYRMLAAQERVRLLASNSDEVIRILRQREEAGEGSRYDRLRAERELAELRTDVVAANALAATRSRISGFLPEATQVQSVRGART
jgi:outer membrane protein TolC